MFKVKNRNTRTRCEICSKLTIKTPERRHASLLLTLNIFHIWAGKYRLGCNLTSIMCNGATDSAAIGKKRYIFIICWFWLLWSQTILFFLQSLGSRDTNGIFSVIKPAFNEKALQEAMSNVVLLALDGALVNTGLKNGLNKLFRLEMSWSGFVWCFSRRLELALKDALSEWTNPIATNLHNSYYVYGKLSKKVRE